jgi:hypothetical protein
MMIGLYSPAQQSGKSTVAGILGRNYGFETRGFALALKRMVIDLMTSAGLTPEQVGFYMDLGKEDPIPELGGKSFRYLTQTLGTDWGRTLVAKDLWRDIVVKAGNRPNLLVVDDVRFPNEFEAIREGGGQIWRIVRPGVVPTSDHPSEGLLENHEFDEVITNDGDIADLEAKVTAAFEAAT